MRNPYCWIALALLTLWVLPAHAHSAPHLTLRVVSGPQPAQGPQVVDVSLFEWGISAGVLQVQAGVVTFQVGNDGQVGHALKVTGVGVSAETEVFAGGQSRTLELTLAPGEYALWCPVAGHRALGMETALSVPGSTGGRALAALDANQNGFIDDAEVLAAVGLWAGATSVPGLGRPLTDAEVLTLVRLWATGQALGS